MTKTVYEFDTSAEKPQGLKPWEQSVFDGLKAKGFPQPSEIDDPLLLSEPGNLSESELSSVKFDDEGVRFLMLCLAREVHHFAASRDIPQGSVEDQLPLVFCELNRRIGDLLDVRCVSAGDASSLAGLSIHFSYPVYRLVAAAAKNRAACLVDGD